MSRKLTLTVLVLSLISCATYTSYYSYAVEQVRDEFDGYSIDRMSGNYLSDKAGDFSNSVWLNIQKYRSKDGHVMFSLIVETWNSEWLFIGPGESLTLLVDGERFGFSGSGSVDHRTTEASKYGVATKEKAWYDVTVEQLKRIADASDVKIKVQGKTSFITRQFAPKNFSNFKRFIAEYSAI